MSPPEPGGRQVKAVLGISRAEYREGATPPEKDEDVVKHATLEEAFQDLAVQARAAGLENVRVVSIELQAGNPHIKEIGVTGT
ncbi:MAG TPA: hypothetical protein VHI12_02360 [Gaiellaceae bacterium]|jgi:hypothetical protein|nr:hypothetical protein [Gaiellaceae bacterium]